jgi:predicted dinucleotide-binding enzyme
VVFSYARSEQKLKRLVREAKGKAQSGTPREAAQEADALLLAVHWSRVDDVLKQAGDVSRKVIVSCVLPMNAAGEYAMPNWRASRFRQSVVTSGPSA